MDLPETVQKRFGSQIQFKPGEEVRMGWYADGILSIGSFRVILGETFGASPDGRYLAGTRHFGKVAVIVDLIAKREEAFVAGNDTLKVRGFKNNAFQYEHRIPEDGYELAQNLLELKLSDVFTSPPSDLKDSDFSRLSH